MSDLLQVRQRLLAPCGLDGRGLDAILAVLGGRGVDDADLYVQARRSESWSLEDGRVRGGSFSVNQGIGARVVSGERTGFAYADDLDPRTVLDAARSARAITRAGGEGAVRAATPVVPRALYLPDDPILALSPEDKVDLLKTMDARARAASPHVVQVMASVSLVHDTVLVIAADGRQAADQRPLVRLNVTVVAERDGRREQGTAGAGGRDRAVAYLNTDVADGLVDEAVRLALVNLDADAAPAGSMTVVLGPGWPGVLLHEAIGHGLEGDFNRKKLSAFSGRLGEQVASPLCTVVDDGSLPGRRGSLTIDDEGTPTGETVLIEEGRLVGYLQDRTNARLMGVPPTGNGRRESYAHLPMPRMTNTFMRAGPHDPAEILASVDKGLYAVNFGGGQVDITSGKFVFSASEAYVIEGGRITRPVRGATLIGNGPDVLTRVSMVGNDLKLDPGIGTCGKEGQSVPVGVGQPTLRVDGLTVGGTQTQ